jgi:MEDS: MEthanogen/methylotroph, DcmR Sensory domain
METASRHQCLIYEGAPSRHLPTIAAALRQNLKHNYRCLYLNSPPMAAGMASYLAACGVDIAHESGRGSLVLSSAQHLVNGKFDVSRMIQSLEDAARQALKEGYAGLWASGDMAWEFGSHLDVNTLIEYERRLEELFDRQPGLSGICQYHAGTLTSEATRIGTLVHRSIFVSESLSVMNPYYQQP